eukprot:CAMPEP_0197843006 /NCGR_PEP_ID=MMETSP1437-20131217/47071_1 /TAXON_ID=49252 ORGANISM="Eucampia antarctica, Strain CCMP1452" /NCGR_SAMPLE_ID=MMETSP1437 /ASSEMBLY_ACC=CAM_ASM_001096 /LENGTH=108 /DNA_ID=CAMNT_0043452979 /DNA_START=700 /DNA_END=1026 /DNA_ORIENTATION=-
MRKPEPLGAEFKCIVDGLLGNMIWLKICESKDRMRTKYFVRDLGSKTACTLQGVTYVRELDFLSVSDDVEQNSKVEVETNPSDTKKRMWLGDSWFGSVRTAANIRMAG